MWWDRGEGEGHTPHLTYGVTLHLVQPHSSTPSQARRSVARVGMGARSPENRRSYGDTVLGAR
jgi:hypothetical protein